MEYKGKIHSIGNTQQITEKFRKRELILVEEGKYTQYICFTFTGDRTDLLDQFELGEEVKVTFGLQGREYNGKFYNTLSAYKVELVNSQPESLTPNDDLPF